MYVYIYIYIYTYIYIIHTRRRPPRRRRPRRGRARARRPAASAAARARPRTASCGPCRTSDPSGSPARATTSVSAAPVSCYRPACAASRSAAGACRVRRRRTPATGGGAGPRGPRRGPQSTIHTCDIRQAESILRRLLHTQVCPRRGPPAVASEASRRRRTPRLPAPAPAGAAGRGPYRHHDIM